MSLTKLTVLSSVVCCDMLLRLDFEKVKYTDV